MSVSRVRPVLAGLCLALTLCGTARAVDVTDTRLLQQPALSATQIAFIYAGDLFVCDLEGRNVRRLTSDAGIERTPVFSPDGSRIAFSAEYDGNVDVFIVPAGGGIPTRLTWHPGADLAQAFTPDGTAVLFTSPRAVFTTRYTQLFTVPVTGGVEAALPIPNAARAAYAADGSRIAYNPLSPSHLQWKRYRGGRVSQVVLYDTKTHATETIAQPASRANDVDPMWLDGTVYFRSDRAGEFNLFAYDERTKAVTQLTRHDDFPVLSASAAAGRIVYEQGGYLHLYDIATQATRRLRIGVVSDLVDRRPHFVKGGRWVRSMALSPTGARAAFEFRGEVVTVPAKKGDARNLTNSPGAHDRSPAWSPDGAHVAYVSDAGGEYALHIAAHDGQGTPRRITLSGSGFYDALLWSPDASSIALRDNGRTIYIVDVASGRQTKVATEPYYRPGAFADSSYNWSPDSKWLVYTLFSAAQIESAHLYSLAQQRSFPLTDGLSDVSEPVFDRAGKHLYLFGSTDAGPVRDWFAQSSTGISATRAIYLVVLAKGEPSPLAPESDEEKPTAHGTPGKPDADAEAAKKDDKAPPTPEPTRIDIDGIATRIVALPVPAGEYRSLQVGAAGKLHYLRWSGGTLSLQLFDMESRKAETLQTGLSDYVLSADGKKLLYLQDEAYRIADAGKKVAGDEGAIDVGAVEVRVDPSVEWAQMFDEAWRINRDYFYATNMHGANWPAVKKKYAAFLPHLAHRDDLTRLIQWMCSELGVGHSYGGGGSPRRVADTVPGGLLGADYEVANGRYRFTKVYGGLNWTPSLRSPLTEPGVDVQAGDYLIAVRGVDVRPPASLYSFFENSAGRQVQITVSPNADGTGARTVTVVPLESEAALRNRDWVEGNLRKVTEATDGRVAYVYVPNTAELGHEYFKRYFYPQTNRDAVIVDERFNGGGQVADYYIDLLRRPLIAYWATRHGAPLRTPSATILGPKVMITDETAGSGGDLLPWMFRKFELGPIVGKRTWGGLVGILGYPVLMDGGNVTAPNLAIFTEDGWVVENEGVAPDIEVEQTPADVIAGRDPQLERAIAVVKEALAQQPPRVPARPADPTRRD